MITIKESDKTQRIIFKENDIEFRIGDKFLFVAPNRDIDPEFYNSNVGRLFDIGKIDSLLFEVKETDWLEIQFEMKLIKDLCPLTNEGNFDECDPADGDWNDEIYTETANYIFIRYLTRK